MLTRLESVGIVHMYIHLDTPHRTQSFLIHNLDLSIRSAQRSPSRSKGPKLTVSDALALHCHRQTQAY